MKSLQYVLSDPPSCPRNLHVSSVTPKCVTITWDAPILTDDSSAVAQYLIEMREEGQAEYLPVGRVDGTVCSYTADFLPAGRRYSFQVRAKNAAGTSEPPTVLAKPVGIEKLGQYCAVSHMT